MSQHAKVRACAWSTLGVVALAFLAACSDVRWVSISEVSATDSAATSLSIFIDACIDVPAPRVIETDTEVHVFVDLKNDYSADQLSCMSGAEAQLAQPIGTRKVIDDRTNVVIPVTWTAVVPRAHLAGSVRELLGTDADATVTAWLIVDQSGSAVLCDDLPAAATTCPSVTMAVDWDTGGTTPPTDLQQRGSVTVSAGPVTLHGSLKVDVLFVGIEP